MSEATTIERLPYGAAKQIVAAMRIGDAITVRPQHMVSFHNAARRLGMRLASVSTKKDGAAMFRMIRVGDGISGHMAQRLPRRDRVTGRWLRDKVFRSAA